MLIEAKAKLVLARDPLLYPVLTNVLENMRIEQTGKDALARMAVRDVLQPLLSMLGMELVRKDGLDIVRFMLRRGILAGGTDMGNYLEDEIIDHIFRNTAIFTPPANVYVGLWTAATGEANDSGTEATGGSYAREAVNTTTGWAAPSNGATSNAADVDFGTATANWGTIGWVDLSSTASGAANRYFHGALAATKTVNDTDTFKFATGDLDVSVA
jgi:hypothetical protein